MAAANEILVSSPFPEPGGIGAPVGRVTRSSMRQSLSFITGTSAVSSVDRTEGTGAGARSLEVVGHDAADGRVYLLEHFHDGDVPQLHFIHTRGPHAGKQVSVHAWYDGDVAEIESRFSDRLARLRKSLIPLAAARAADWRLTTRVIKRRALRLDPGDAPIRKYTLQLAVRPANDSVHGGAIATVTAYLRPRASLDAVFRLGPRYLALASYTGVPLDIGHPRQIAVLL